MRKNEEWRELEWGPYLVSSEGRLAKFRRTWTGPHGYKRAHCRKFDGTLVPAYEHQLVAEAFLGPIPDGCEIHHRNGDKSDNRAVNLEYVTKGEHVVKGNMLGQVPKGERHWHSRFTADDVRDIRQRVAAGEDRRAIAKEYGCHVTTVGEVVRRVTWRHIE